MTKKATPNVQVYNIEDVKAGNVVIESDRCLGLFTQIRKEVDEVYSKVGTGKAIPVRDLFRYLPSLAKFKGARRYNYLRNALSKIAAYEFINKGGLFLAKK